MYKFDLKGFSLLFKECSHTDLVQCFPHLVVQIVPVSVYFNVINLLPLLRTSKVKKENQIKEYNL